MTEIQTAYVFDASPKTNRCWLVAYNGTHAATSMVEIYKSSGTLYGSRDYHVSSDVQGSKERFRYRTEITGCMFVDGDGLCDGTSLAGDEHKIMRGDHERVFESLIQAVQEDM